MDPAIPIKPLLISAPPKEAISIKSDGRRPGIFCMFINSFILFIFSETKPIIISPIDKTGTSHITTGDSPLYQTIVLSN